MPVIQCWRSSPFMVKPNEGSCRSDILPGVTGVDPVGANVSTLFPMVHLRSVVLYASRTQVVDGWESGDVALGIRRRRLTESAADDDT